MFSSFLPSLLHSPHALLLRHKWRIISFQISRSTGISIGIATAMAYNKPIYLLHNTSCSVIRHLFYSKNSMLKYTSNKD